MINEKSKNNEQEKIRVRFQDAAKQLCTIAPILQAAYFAAISMSDLKRAVAHNLTMSLLFISPVCFWVVSIFLAAQVFIPVKTDETTTYDRVNDRRYKTLKYAFIFLLSGMMFMAYNMFHYFMFIDLASPVTTQTMTLPKP